MSPSPLRIVYMGTPDFAVPALRALAASQHEVVGVFTNPDRPAGRGKSVRASAVKRAARELDLPVYQPPKLRGNDDAYAQLQSWAPDVAVVAAYGQILPERFLDVPDHGCLNIHASLLPKYRGAAPINWAIIDGESESGVTIMQMEVGLDTGPILLAESTPIGELTTAQELHDELAEMGARLAVDAVERLRAGTLEPTPQDDDRSTYARMMSKEDGRIDWSAPARDIANLIRGVNPWPGAFTYLGKKRIKLHLARAVDVDATAGMVVEAGERLVVGCGNHAVEILEIQAPGSRAMPALDFLNGFPLEPGDVFH